MQKKRSLTQSQKGKKKMLVFLHKKNLANNIHTYVLCKNIYVGKAKFKGMRKD